MTLELKLRPDRSITGAIIPLSIIPIFGIATLIFGLAAGIFTLAVSMLVYSMFYLYTFLRTGNIAQLIICADDVFFGIMLLILEPEYGIKQMANQQFKVAYLSGLFFFGLILFFMALTKRMKWRGREIFELAGKSVDETGNGYTSRPRPVGKVEYSPEQIRAFARFCAKNLIALPYYDAKNITLVPIKMGDEFGRVLGLSGDYRNASWVNFDINNGEVSVHISQKDYLDYRDPLAFDQLCTSLGQVFVDFLEMFDKGEGVRVIGQIDDLKLGIFS